MNIVIAPDSFKGSLSAREAGLAMERGIRRVNPDSIVKVVPMADGGEGTMECLISATEGRFVTRKVMNPLGREIESGFGILGNGTTCIIEMAMSSGLYLIESHERDPMRTTTYGFGQLITAALDQGCREFILAVGGSATNDGGAGMLQALGVKLLGADGEDIGFGGGELAKLHSVQTDDMDPRLSECAFIIACDVQNPLIGPKGASAVFGPQKGATPAMVSQLDENLKHFADVIERTLGAAIHHIPGTGAAGGLAGGILAFLNGKLESGISIVARVTGLEEAMQGADLVLTGEGRVDFQTVGGKTPYGVARLAKSHGVPVIILAGSVGEGVNVLYEHGVLAVLSIVNRPMTLEEAMAHTGPLLEDAAEQVMRIIHTTAWEDG
ncbi:glycerate kinase [Paenibacillus sp. 1011MAR3C5]|uniref:glycerate kinase family protein n=1 Tax=Paenibacillus sp. 1011MAR3C5 TaxID=1675787 RepID=UPI000E6D36C5|nr:glycerate kinase [Paenibacillus sp. 1011MAR3C5]RJE86109.1 glycerate kinase [Paenibacillus sp. 1011MAR3C5]